MFVILIIKTLGSGFKYSTFDYCDLSRFWPQFKFSVNYMIPVAYHQSKRDHTEIICFFFVTPKKDMILGMPIVNQ